MDVLIVKLGAAGDVVRTTTLLRSLCGEITWLTDTKNTVLLKDVPQDVRCFSWEERDSCRDRKYDLVINLEDGFEVATYLSGLDYRRLWGAQLGSDDSVVYTEDSRCWFDLSIVSRHGRQQADELKLANRSTYQELIFQGLGLRFSGETYLLPPTPRSQLTGDVAIASEAGPVWPMKKWAFYDELQQKLEAAGLVVNLLPKRPSLLEHLADVCGHRCLVSGDTLPMHFALGSGIPCVSLFTCTSPWEIHEYGLQKKIVSPALREFFYQRGYDHRATAAIGVEEVWTACMQQLEWGKSGHLQQEESNASNTSRREKPSRTAKGSTC
jgi:heptosyltransferase-2